MPAAAESRFTAPSNPLSTNNEGVITLAWESPAAEPGSRFELQQSATGEFPEATVKQRYLGPDTASVLTGFSAGDYHFRVRAIGKDDSAGAWSEPVSVEISYMPVQQVVLLLGAGVTIFIATVATLLAGHFKSPAAG